jgi:hypothetical protein
VNPSTRAARSRALVQLLSLVCGLLMVSTGRLAAQLIYADSFSYPDGQIDNAPGSPWALNYLPTNQMFVTSGRLFLTRTNQESIRYDFPDNYVTGSLYARMVVNVSQFPSGDGNFFAFFRVSGTDNLRGRIWVSTNGAAVGKFRFGVTTIFFPPTLIAQDFYPGTNYTLVLRYSVVDNHSTLWVDPGDESDTNNRADDLTNVGAITMGHFGFAQIQTSGTDSDIGSLTVDDLRIGRTFAEVLPLSKITAITNAPAGGRGMQAVGQATSNYVFQATTNIASANWVNLSTNAADTNGNFNFSDGSAANFPSRFYRLLKQ